MHFYEIMNMRVPFVDFEDELNVIGNDIERAIKDVIISKKFILGPKVELFENDFARHCGSKHAIGVSSGTAALHLALESLNIKEGDEVIITANTFIWAAMQYRLNCSNCKRKRDKTCMGCMPGTWGFLQGKKCRQFG